MSSSNRSVLELLQGNWNIDRVENSRLQNSFVKAHSLRRLKSTNCSIFYSCCSCMKLLLLFSRMASKYEADFSCNIFKPNLFLVINGQNMQLGWSFTIARPHYAGERWKHTTVHANPSRQTGAFHNRSPYWRLMWTENVLKTELFENYRETTVKIRKSRIRNPHKQVIQIRENYAA